MAWLRSSLLGLILLKAGSCFMSPTSLIRATRFSSPASRAVSPSRVGLPLRGGAGPAMGATSTPEPKTGTQTIKKELKDEAVSLFFSEPAKCTPTSGGVNNVVNYVETSDGQKYILRIYNNGKNSARVRFEHEVLRQLRDEKLSFQIPRTVPSLKDKRSHVLLSNGAEACVFEIIPGSLPKTTSPRDIGRATGELLGALEKVQLATYAGCAPPYYDLYKVHHAITRDLFYKEIETNKDFDTCRESIDFLVDEIRKLEGQLVKFQEKNLPKQLIHGDLHYDNVLCVGDKVSGLLDFEFCAYDWRAMELAICLSKYAGDSDPLPLFQSFVDGYVEHATLSQDEIEMVPDLINLRILSNVVYFVGRAIAIEDSIDSLTSRAKSYASRVRWINDNRSAIVDAINSRLAAAAAARK